MKWPTSARKRICVDVGNQFDCVFTVDAEQSSVCSVRRLVNKSQEILKTNSL